MVRLVTNCSDMANEASELVRAFFPKEKVDFLNAHCHENVFFILSINWSEDSGTWLCTLLKGERLFHAVESIPLQRDGEDVVLFKRRKKAAMKKAVYSVLKQLTGKSLPYGMLTGVRPLTIVKRLGEGTSTEEIEQYLQKEYDISGEKAHLLSTTASVQESLHLDNNAAGLYINIPFCPSKCNYCSFPSELISAAEPYMDRYLDALERELWFVLEHVKTPIDCLYVGGGTPTCINERAFARLTKLCREVVKAKGIQEFTLEAGRPDTIHKEKLSLMKEAGVTRISINPQTMNQGTLDRIGRRHTVQEVEAAFACARELGFHNINMDLILGLEGEKPLDVQNSYRQVFALDPEAITVHVLALKHASELNRAGTDIFSYHAMLSRSHADDQDLFEKHGYYPYYLYRQKYMLENLENVGYAKQGKECIYNIRMMDDGCTCWAVGAGAISKRCFGGTRRIERQANPKNLKDYVGNIEILLERKEKLIAEQS